jgi:hypothetical protein
MVTTLVFPSLDALLRNRGIQPRTDGGYMEDGYDFGVRWCGPGLLVHRLTWLGPLGRTEDSAPPGELYLLALGMANGGAAELLCVIPPVEGDPAYNVRAILDGWQDVCGEPNSVNWVRDRVGEALRAGWATVPQPATHHPTGPSGGDNLRAMTKDEHRRHHERRR